MGIRRDSSHLADKTGQLVPSAPAKRYETLSWVFFQMSAVGPIFGQLGFFVRLGGKDSEDQRPRKRFLPKNPSVFGSLTDSWKVATGSLTNIRLRTLPRSVNALVESYDAGEILDSAIIQTSKHGLGRGLARPAVQRGLRTPVRLA
jgi:GST-like protein